MNILKCLGISFFGTLILLGMKLIITLFEGTDYIAFFKIFSLIMILNAILLWIIFKIINYKEKW